MVPYNYTDFIDGLTYLVKNKFVPLNRIDDAVERILLVKFTMGLFENPLADLSLTNEVGSQVVCNLLLRELLVIFYSLLYLQGVYDIFLFILALLLMYSFNFKVFIDLCVKYE